MRRYKTRLKDHHPAQKAAENARVVVLQASPLDDDNDDAADTGDEGQAGSGPAQPMVIAESSSPVRTLTVGMAVLELEVSNYPVLLFRNVAHGGLSVVYRRPDGNIGWIDPERANGAGAGEPAGRPVATNGAGGDGATAASV
jgi:hypothetical protein